MSKSTGPGAVRPAASPPQTVIEVIGPEISPVNGRNAFFLFYFNGLAWCEARVFPLAEALLSASGHSGSWGRWSFLGGGYAAIAVVHLRSSGAVSANKKAEGPFPSPEGALGFSDRSCGGLLSRHSPFHTDAHDDGPGHIGRGLGRTCVGNGEAHVKAVCLRAGRARTPER